MRTFDIHLDKIRKLVFNNRALYELEGKLGEPIMLLFQDQKKLSSIKVISTLIWAGLLKENDLTFDEVIDLIPSEKIKDNLVIVIKALGESLGVEEGAIEKELEAFEKKSRKKA